MTDTGEPVTDTGEPELNTRVLMLDNREPELDTQRTSGGYPENQAGHLIGTFRKNNLIFYPKYKTTCKHILNRY